MLVCINKRRRVQKRSARIRNLHENYYALDVFDSKAEVSGSVSNKTFAKCWEICQQISV